MRVDVIRDLIDRLLAAAHRDGTLTESVAIEIEQQIRHEYKGKQIEISERPRRQLPAPAITADYLAGRPVEEITHRHGISRATLYRILKR